MWDIKCLRNNYDAFDSLKKSWGAHYFIFNAYKIAWFHAIHKGVFFLSLSPSRSFSFLLIVARCLLLFHLCSHFTANDRKLKFCMYIVHSWTQIEWAKEREKDRESTSACVHTAYMCICAIVCVCRLRRSTHARNKCSPNSWNAGCTHMQHFQRTRTTMQINAWLIRWPAERICFIRLKLTIVISNHFRRTGKKTTKSEIWCLLLCLFYQQTKTMWKKGCQVFKHFFLYFFKC